MFNVTAWLYVDEQGVQNVQVNPNIPISQLREQYGNAETEVGIHSECTAGEFFRTRPQLRVLQIFTERIPCTLTCGPLLRAYFPGVPWYYYYDKRAWFDAQGRLLRSAAQVLTTAYEFSH
jgi:hypothetical protein